MCWGLGWRCGGGEGGGELGMGGGRGGELGPWNRGVSSPQPDSKSIVIHSFPVPPCKPHRPEIPKAFSSVCKAMRLAPAVKTPCFCPDPDWISCLLCRHYLGSSYRLPLTSQARKQRRCVVKERKQARKKTKKKDWRQLYQSN